MLLCVPLCCVLLDCPYGRSLETSGGGGGGWVLKAKLLEEKYEANLEFPGEYGGAKQKPSIGEYGYFLELHEPVCKCIM